MAKGKRRELDTASNYQPPARMVTIADERTRAILREWSYRLQWGPVDFRILAESCYLQGVNDVIDALQQQGLTVTAVVDDGPWEGYCG